MFTMYSVFSHQWWRNFVSYKLSICFCSILALLVLVMLQKLPDYIRRIQVSFIQLFLLPPDAGMNASGTRPTYFPDGFFACTSAGDTLSRLQQALPILQNCHMPGPKCHTIRCRCFGLSVMLKIHQQGGYTTWQS